LHFWSNFEEVETWSAVATKLSFFNLELGIPQIRGKGGLGGKLVRHEAALSIRSWLVDILDY
jgi:hypothetical protein